MRPLVTNNVLDYESTNGMKLYNKATQALPFLFDLKQQNFTLFLENVRNRAMIHNWIPTLSVLMPDGETLNLIDHYGRVSLTQVCTSASNYIGLEILSEQNSSQIYACLMSSLTEEAVQTLMDHV